MPETILAPTSRLVVSPHPATTVSVERLSEAIDRILDRLSEQGAECCASRTAAP